MKLTVFGATGGIGKHVVRQALDAGHQVTAVVRDTSQRTPATGLLRTTSTPLDVRHERLEVVTVPGLTDPEPLLPALKGSDAAISGVGPRSRQDLTVASGTVRVILAALRQAEVQRFVAVSAAPVGPVPEGENWFNRRLVYPLISALLRGIYADLAVMEEEIAASGTDWTVVRPPKLVERPLTGAYRSVVGGNVPRARTMSRTDVAHAMLASLADPTTIRQFLGVAR